MEKIIKNLILISAIFLLIVKTAGAEIKITEVPVNSGFTASYNSDHTVMTKFNCNGAWLSSIIEEFSEKNTTLKGLGNLPKNRDNSYKNYKLSISDLPQTSDIIREKVVSLISEQFKLNLKYKTETVYGFSFDFKSHTIPLQKSDKAITEVRGIKQNRFVGYSFDSFKNVLHWNCKKPITFYNAPTGFYTFDFEGKLTDVQSVLNWAKKHNIIINDIPGSARVLIIEKQKK